MLKYDFLKGTFILTLTGFLSRIIGFFYRILLSQTIGAEGLGVYQLIFPIQNLLLALTASGLQTAISRFTASHYAKKNTQGTIQIFFSGTVLSLLLSISTSILLYFNRTSFGLYLLKEPRTIPLLLPLAFIIPLSTFHGCISSYYYGLKKTGLPSIILLLEQSFRVLSFCILCTIFLKEGKQPTPDLAIYASLCGEVSSVIVSLLAVSLQLKSIHFSFSFFNTSLPYLREILSFSLPLTANRVLLTLLSSIEAALIPQMLQKHGLSANQSLSQYGIFSGMAIPLILFPATLTHSIATMLLPLISELQALHDMRKIRSTISRVLSFCFLLGTFFGCLFFFFGNFLGNFLFHQEAVGMYLRYIAPVCPFLYTNTITASIFIGLGKPQISLVHNVIILSLRILFIVFFIPAYGIHAYLWAILIAEFSLTFLNVKVLFSLNSNFKVDKSN